MSVRRVSRMAVAAMGTLLVSGGCAMDRVTAPEAGGTQIRIVGAPTVSGREPLIIIDGVAIPRFSNSDLNPTDIHHIEVLKGPAATQIYGERGRDGVIVITTKRGAR